MKLINSLFNILSATPAETGGRYDIRLNPEHVIYRAHFPGHPITPGVCIVEIGLELLEEHLQRSLEIRMLKNVKFLAVISPDDVQEISYELKNVSEEDGVFRSQVVVSSPEKIYAKLSMICSQTTKR